MQIQKAREKGEFDNLKGAGKPIIFEENPYQPPELRMVYKILKDNDFTPYWIQLGKEIDADLKKFWSEVEYFKLYTKNLYQDKPTKAAVQRYNKKKETFFCEQRLALEKINKKILNYNLHCPTYTLGRGSIVVDEEMDKVISQIEQLLKEIGQEQ